MSTLLDQQSTQGIMAYYSTYKTALKDNCLGQSKENSLGVYPRHKTIDIINHMHINSCG